jgi:hypothetical protein
LADRIEASELEGSKTLIGITRMQDDESYAQEQFVGIATVQDRESYCLVTIDCEDGEAGAYPFDVRTLQRAPKGDYRLRSTGQIVTDPDFLMTWIVTKE